jgi:histone H3/H4
VKNVPELPLAAMDRIIRKAGRVRVSRGAALEMSAILETYITELTREAIKLAEHRGAKTISGSDIKTAATRYEFKL